jgi:tetratricopeptide (TPR) repeat protein
MSNTNVIGEIQRQRVSAGVGTTPPPPPPPAAEKKEEIASFVDPRLAEAKKKFDAGMEYAKANESNLYAVALRWFQIADQISGTDYSVKAMSLARAAQERFAELQKKATPAAGGGQPAPEDAGTPEMQLIKEGDKYLEAGNFEKAIGAYGASLQKKETILANRRLGHAHFDRAQAQKEALLPQFEAVDTEYRAAYRAAVQERRSMLGVRRYVDWNSPALVEAKKKVDELNAKARIALNNYDAAATRFNALLKLAPQGKDLDASGHAALCYSVRRADAAFRARGRQLLVAFLEGYKPANDIERTVYEFCRTELEQLNAPKTPQY